MPPTQEKMYDSLEALLEQLHENYTSA